ncbi:MAG: hypothetical protein K0S06_3872 [Microvirga sp.]|jgi:hypothetical protein|nr:hypothetical protein [Microvirga sp.]
MSKRQRRHSFPYELRAAEAAAAQRAVHTTFAEVRRRDDPDDPATAAWLAAIARFRAAVPAAYPPGFWEDVARLAKGDPEGLETAIRFLEADPYFDRSGYVKADLIRLVTRLPLDPDESARLRNVAIDAVDRRGRREFRAYCRLARRLDGPELREALAARLMSRDAAVARRASWMIEALGPAAT